MNRPLPGRVTIGSADEIAGRVAAAVAEAGGEAVRARRTFHLAVSGGRTPLGVYRGWATNEFAGPPWDRTELWLADERAVPIDHPESNERALRAAGLDTLGATFHGYRRSGSDPVVGYARRLTRRVPLDENETPVLDVVLLGLGADGHTAGLFAGSPALESREIMAHGTSPTGIARWTVTIRTLLAARALFFLVMGTQKTPALQEPGAGPAGLLLGHPSISWFLDEAAAFGIDPSL
jgi:6-phosphogluconolactonase